MLLSFYLGTYRDNYIILFVVEFKQMEKGVLLPFAVVCHFLAILTIFTPKENVIVIVITHNKLQITL